MKLISNDLRDGDKLPHRHVFNGMGYDGDNISPHLALHYVFNSPVDKIVYDVSHQSYVHKMVTGRALAFLS